MSPGKVEAVIKSLQATVKKKKNLKPDSFIEEFCQAFKEKLAPILLKLFNKQKQKKHFRIHFMRPPLP